MPGQWDQWDADKNDRQDIPRQSKGSEERRKMGVREGGDGIGRRRVTVKERCLHLHWHRRVTLSDVARMRLGSVRTGGQRTKVAEMRPARTERAAR